MALILRSAGASPYARKVRIAAQLLGLADDIEIVPAKTRDPEDTLSQQNPLGKLPVLILESGEAVYDSRVILEFLDARAGGGIIPKDTDARFRALTLAALADGILDAALLIVYEGRYRPDQEPCEPWVGRQRDKILRALAALEAAPPAFPPVTVGVIGLASALGYLEFREIVDWRGAHPGLVKWLDGFAAKVPAFAATAPVG